MRHRKAGLKLNRTTSHRNAMFRNMVTSLFKHERIRTTDTKAKELRRWADNLITLAKRGDLHARRQALALIRERAVVHKLFNEAEERFGSVAGGYTRIVRLGRRPGDAAPVALVELIESPAAEKKKRRKKKKTPTAEKKPAAPRKADKGDSSEAPGDSPSKKGPEMSADAPSSASQNEGATEEKENAQPAKTSDKTEPSE